MKKSLLIAVILILFSFAGCSVDPPLNTDNTTPSDFDEVDTQNTTVSETVPNTISSAITEADALFSNHEYDQALELYKNLADELDSIPSILYQRGVELYQDNQYAYCIKYMNAIQTDEAHVYVFLSEAFNHHQQDKQILYVQSHDINYLDITKEIKRLSDAGVQIATEALAKEPFCKYLELISCEGFYRSMDTITHQDFLGSYEKYTYLNINSDIVAMGFATDALVPITQEKVLNNAGKENYKSYCVYNGETFDCIIYYDDMFSGKTEGFTFKIHIDNEEITITSSDFDSDGDKAVADGEYIRID